MKRSALALAAALVAPALAPAGPTHGGVYRGPGTGVGPGGSAPGGATPSSGGAAGGSSEWSAWWSFNRDPYLALKDALEASDPSTGGDDFYLGRGQALETPSSRRPSEALLRERVVPALMRALAAEDDADLVTACLVALAKIGFEAADPELPRLEPLFASRLASQNLEIAETAALALGVLGRDAAAPLLGELLDDTEEARRLVERKEVPDRTRALAAYGLGLVASRSERADARGFAVQRLTGALASGAGVGPDLPTAALLALGLVQLPASAAFAAEVDLSKGVLARSREELAAWLLAWFRESDVQALVRAHAPVALARHARGAAPGARAAVTAALLEQLRPGKDAPQDVRRAATIALGVIEGGAGAPDAALCDTLLRLASDRDGFVRGVARISLARLAARGAASAETDETNETEAPDLRGWLLRDLARGRTTTRGWTALALGVMEHQRLVAGLEPSNEVRAALRESLKGEDSPSDAGALCIAAGLCRDLDAAELVRAQLTGPGPEGLRAYAAVALGLMGDRDSIEALREVVRGSTYKPGLQREAAIALGLLGDRQVVPDLASALRAADTLSSQSSLASALGTIGDARAIEPLLALLGDREASVTTRAFAAAALGIVGDKERLPWNSKLGVDLYYGAPPPTLVDPLGARGVMDLL